MEEYLWHGLPGNPWHPLEGFLEAQGSRFPPAAQEQLRRWKEARLGLFQIGRTTEDRVELREWDVTTGECFGPVYPSISLGMQGVDLFRRLRGYYALTYLAPWNPEENLFCAMGYGVNVPRDQAEVAAGYLGLQHPEIVAEPLPWALDRRVVRDYLKEWRAR